MPPKPELPTACVFQVNVVKDGFGDFGHFENFLSAINPDELVNAYFVIHTNRDGDEHQKIIDMISFLPEGHVLRRYKDKVIYVALNTDAEMAGALREKINGPFSNYQVSFARFGGEKFSALIRPEGAIFSAGLFEHGFSPTSDSNHGKLLGFKNTMGIGPKSAGIFIPKSEANLPVVQQILDKLVGPAESESALTICYSHVNTESNIQQLCRLHISNNKGKPEHPPPITLFFPKGVPLKLLDETRALLQQANCTLVGNKEAWVAPKDFEQLRIKQAKSAIFGVAAGDKTTEYCFAEGLFPIIEYKSYAKGKRDFWLGLVATLEGMLTEGSITDQESLNKIITYIQCSMYFCDYPNEDRSKLTTSIEALNPKCFALWKDVVCPYIRENHDVTKNIATNVKIFRMLTELQANPNSQYAATAREFFSSLDEATYKALILVRAEKIAAYQQPIEGENAVTEDAICLQQLLKIRDSYVSLEIKNKVAQLVVMSHITGERIQAMRECVMHPNYYRFMQFDHKDIDALKTVFEQAYNNLSKASAANILTEYENFLENLAATHHEGKDFVANIISQMSPLLADIVKPVHSITTPKHPHGMMLYLHGNSHNKPTGLKVLSVTAGPHAVARIEDGEKNQEIIVMTICKSKKFKDKMHVQTKLIDDYYAVAHAFDPSAKCIDDINEVTFITAKLPGQPLTEFLKLNTSLSDPEKLKIIEATIIALQKLHEAKIFHGNITAENIIIDRGTDEKYSVNFTDFTLSSIINKDGNAVNSQYKRDLHIDFSSSREPTEKDPLGTDSAALGGALAVALGLKDQLTARLNEELNTLKATLNNCPRQL